MEDEKCHNLIRWLICSKQCRPWSDCSFKCCLICVYTVCSCLSVPKLRIFMVFIQSGSESMQSVYPNIYDQISYVYVEFGVHTPKFGKITKVDSVKGPMASSKVSIFEKRGDIWPQVISNASARHVSIISRKTEVHPIIPITETSPYSFGNFRKFSLYNCFMPI